jgi:hypothetical protein
MSATPPGGNPSQTRASAYLGMPIAEFLQVSPAILLGTLTESSNFDIELPQRGAWEETIAILKSALPGIDGYLYLEFDVPRLGSRIDAVVISGPAIIPIEFKAGESRYPREAINQAWDYALDLKNFHRASHQAPIFPILVATNAPPLGVPWAPPHPDGVRPPFSSAAEELPQAIRAALTLAEGTVLDGAGWGRAPYHPTPTIIQAARALYAQHSVEAISRSDAGAKNLAITSKRVEEVIDEARTQHKKAIVFVTGVPGAGKTLVGLNIATHRRDEHSPTHSVFLSGNGPLVAVLREALIRDDFERRKARGKPVRKGVISQQVKPFIQNVHHFRDDGLRDEALPPHDHVVIFDEAQRAWNLAKTSDFMRRRKKRPGFTQSEPQFLISYMDRHEDWAVIVCLVGGGQEIHTGEAGIGAWLEAVRDHFPHWQVFVSPRLTDAEYAADETIRTLPESTRVTKEENLHLAVSMRSFRSERVSEFVKTVLDIDANGARGLIAEISEKYPIALTRDLARAKAWIREQARGNERYGLVASSQASRLKPHAIDIRVDVDPVQWFLNDADDTRSSYYLEDAATEFQIQGLELDWTCMTWDADLRYGDDGWGYHQFRGKRWERCRQPERQKYMLNAYRVLLTRARQGMVIVVPRGEPSDPTREPKYYDGTYGYLLDVGLVELQ